MESAWLTPEIQLLTATAAAVAFFHTLLGPDHYLPFMALGRARNWTVRRTLTVTLVCGMGHVLSSVLIGCVGIVLGLGLSHLVLFETARGEIAAWLLMGFGLAYTVWGLHRALRNRPHSHEHVHADGTVHVHVHAHAGGHVHVHPHGNQSMTPWVLFTIFVFGPCEPLIPVLMYPATRQNIPGLVLVTAVFTVVTLATMLTIVAVTARGMRWVRLGPAERYAHALAGATVCICGVAIVFLGL